MRNSQSISTISKITTNHAQNCWKNQNANSFIYYHFITRHVGIENPIIWKEWKCENEHVATLWDQNTMDALRDSNLLKFFKCANMRNHVVLL